MTNVSAVRGHTDLPALKARVPIPLVWQWLNLPGLPGRSCHSPFRTDRKPSFTVSADGSHWRDFGTGDGGDVIAFLAQGLSVDNAEATRRFIALCREHGLGLETSVLPNSELRHAAKPAHPAAKDAARSKLDLPPLHPPSAAEIAAVARSRCLTVEAVSLGASLGTVVFGNVCGFPCWILTDAAGRIAEARRLDGQPFPALGYLNERKAHTLRGSQKAWPVGVAVLRRFPATRAILMVEGGPDYLAALHFCLTKGVYDVLPVAMLGRGAGTRLPYTALRLLAGRAVRLFPHVDADGGGLASAQLWAAQLQPAGCTVDLFHFNSLTRRDGRPVTDLNDAAVLCNEHQNHLQNILHE